ncbi:hypothetical protein L7F22_047261 [Adiantum nelumboides]|nr:hypothetical protein [Adiantum nelumboides]
MKVWGCSQADANGRVHAFFESGHFKDGNVPIPETHQSLVQLVEFCDLVIVTSRQHVIRHQMLEWIERHFPRIFSDVYFGNHFALEGEARPKSEICMNARFKGHPVVLPKLVLVEQVVLTPSIELYAKIYHVRGLRHVQIHQCLQKQRRRTGSKTNLHQHIQKSNICQQNHYLCLVRAFYKFFLC